MTGLDTNVILSLVLGREEVELSNPPYRVSHVALAEAVWVMATTYKLRRPEIAETLGRILSTAGFVIDAAPVAERALEAYRARGDYAAHLIALGNQSAGCATTLTFDKKAARHDGFTLVQ